MIVVHADWGTHPRKRWIARARSLGPGWAVEAVEPWTLGASPLECLGLDEEEPGPILIGLDFPVGLPLAYARAAEIRAFGDALLGFGGPGWEKFYAVARTPAEISLRRPFYPHAPGGTLRRHLEDGLGIPMAQVSRECERATATRPAACPLFWTLGASQVGKGAIAGWQEVVVPLVREGAALWPFDGELADLLRTRRVTIAETYPAEYYGPLGFGRGWSKRRQADRRDRARQITRAAAALGAVVPPAIATAVDDGFGPRPDGEDAFDTLVGLLGMLTALAGDATAPSDPAIRSVEGWILGQVPA